MKLSICIIILAVWQTSCSKSKKDSDHPNPKESSWRAAHADARNSDYSPVKGSRKISLLWQKKFSGTVNLGPTTDNNGQVYITTSAPGCHLYALDPRTGEQRWCTDKVNKYAVASSALIDKNNRLYIADDRAMNSFDNNGNLLWQHTIQGFPLSAQFTQSGSLLFITHIGKVYVIETATGKPLIDGQSLSENTPPATGFDPRACMQGTVECPCANTLAYDEQNGRFYFTYWQPGTPSAALWAMQYSEQEGQASVTKLWENNLLPGGSASSPDISFDGTRIYVNDNEGGLYAIAAATGNLIWKYTIGYNTGGSQSTSPDGYIMPAGANGAALMCLKDEGDHARLVWRNDAMANRGVSTQSAGNLAYTTIKSASDRFSNDLVVVDVVTGEVLDRDSLPGKTYFSVGTTIGPEGNIYVPTFNGYLFAFGPQ
jgi:outer membrane protein assembly factor BamB